MTETSSLFSISRQMNEIVLRQWALWTNQQEKNEINFHVKNRLHLGSKGRPNMIIVTVAGNKKAALHYRRYDTTRVEEKTVSKSTKIYYADAWKIEKKTDIQRILKKEREATRTRTERKKSPNMPNFIRLNIVLNHILWPRLHSWDNAWAHTPEVIAQMTHTNEKGTSLFFCDFDDIFSSFV